MRTPAGLLLLLCLAMRGATPAAAAPVPVSFGKGIRRLQNLVDQRYGPGRIDVTRDYIGARADDPDPWYWVGLPIASARVTVVKRDPDQNLVGWYQDGGTAALMPPGGGVLFSGKLRPHEEAWLGLPSTRTCFGFYIEAATPFLSRAHNEAPEPKPVIGVKRFYTDRKLNDCGLDGTGSTHPPFDGDMQALVFDVSRWVGTDAWLVCFEDQDTGGGLIEPEDDDGKSGSGGRQDQDPDEPFEIPLPKRSNLDFNDVVFEVRTEGATNARPISFGALKLLYR
jgi:hypothetical protein